MSDCEIFFTELGNFIDKFIFFCNCVYHKHFFISVMTWRGNLEK